MLKTPEILELQKLCRRTFPERLDQRIAQFATRFDDRRQLLFLSLSWTEGRRPRVERLVVRSYVDAWTPWSFDDRAKARREWAIMGWLYGEGLPVPRVYAAGDNYVLMEHIPGRSIEMLQDDWKRYVESCLNECVSLLARLHQVQPPEAVREVLPAAVAQAELGRMGDLARQCGDGGLEEAVAELKALFATEKMELYPPCVLLGETAFVGAQFDARGITALLDWADSAFGDPRWDVARTVNWLRVRQADALAERFLTTYQERTGRALADMDAWLALTAAQNWALTAWLRDRLSDSPLIAQREGLIEQAWRALTRLRSANQQISKATNLQSTNL